MVNRSDKYSIETKKVQTFSDFMSNFDMNPMTGYLARVTNEDSVKQSIRNLILTERTERFHNSSIGSKINSLLFEPVDVTTSEMLKTTISETIKNYEPRAELQRVNVQAREELNAYLVDIIFSVVTIQNESFSLNLILRKVR